MAIFFTADPHFGHANIIEYCKRPFSSVEEMDETLIARWNERITSRDDVYVIGDFAYKSARTHMESVFRRLNGRKHLVIGNHDSKYTLRLPWASKPEHRVRLKIDGALWVLDHYAQRAWEGMERGSFHVFGHTHARLPGVGRSTDVGVDAWDFWPVTPAEVMERIQVMNVEPYDPYFEPAAPRVLAG